MTEKRFTDIEHDYENAWIKCKDDGDFMIYAIYGDLDESLPSLGDLLNGLDGTVKDLSDDYEQLLKKNKELKARYNRCIEEMDSLAEVNDKFYKENEELKHDLKLLQDSLWTTDVIRNLEKEKEQLKQAISDWKGSYDELYQDIKILEKENKELKAKVDDKEVAVEVECEKLMQKVFNLINAKIKLYSHKPVSAPISQPMSVNFDADVDRLARLSELEALKEELIR